jgi:hypothetical protein
VSRLFDTRKDKEVVILDDTERGCWVKYSPRFLSLSQADSIFEFLTSKTPFEIERPTVYGRTFEVKRRSYSYGDPGTTYRYANVERSAMPWPPETATPRGDGAAQRRC